MKKVLPVLAILVFSVAGLLANTGDTIRIYGQNKVNMTSYGNYDDTAVFPPDSNTYHKILMHYVMGCATGGCSDFDYITLIEMLQHSGLYDTAVTYAPTFTVNGMEAPFVVFDTTVTWQTFYDTSTHHTDSIRDSLSLLIREYYDTTAPYKVTDSFYAYPAGYWKDYYDTSGNVIDSAYVIGSDIWYLGYNDVDSLYEVLQPHELGRVITPFGAYYNSINNWSRDYVFDVTDYAPLLHDTVILRDYYNGFTSGFSVTLFFEMIEGTPPRPIRNIHPLFNGYFAYGSSTDSIANHLPSMSFATTDSETNAMFRITPTGHGEGSYDSCDEFCDKTYDFYVNNIDQFTKNIWRGDCGMNPLMHQSGIWIFNRANWCPGWYGFRQDYEFPQGTYTPGDTITVQVQMEPYTEPGGGASLDLAGELFTYGKPNLKLDATIDDIIQPSASDEYVRFNPVCGNPKVVVRNLGSDTLTSVKIHYGIIGSYNYDYTWSGSLSFNQSDTVMLPNILLNDSTTGHTFQAYTYLPNGQADDYPYDDTARTYAAFPPVYDSIVIFELLTNLNPTENNWWLTNAAGDTVYQNDASTYLASTLYRDTFHLPRGCYSFILNDKGGDGLYFPEAPSGQGSAAFYNPDSLIYNFQPDFGSQIGLSFTVVPQAVPGNCSAKFTLYQVGTNTHQLYALNQSTGAAPISYSWRWGDGDTSTGAYPTHVYDINGSYTICLSIVDSNGCSSSYCDSIPVTKSDSIPVTVIVDGQLPAGVISVASDIGVKIYPNPTKGGLTVNVTLPEAQTLNIEIYNSIGQLMSTRTETGFTSGTINYDLSQFAPDIYCIRVSNKMQSVIRKVILQK